MVQSTVGAQGQVLSTPDQAARVIALLEERQQEAIRLDKANVEPVPKPVRREMISFALDCPTTKIRVFMVDDGSSRLFWDGSGLLIDVYPDRVVDFDHAHSPADVALFADVETLIRELEASVVAQERLRR